ncbi:MAG TPA: large-conductance mechanosensitive channel protein MscL [Candidatus Acidoferrum sp.]|nr:large-conductance mechanosensitive channel protein MscL [Candidatus Acidoferrum sp.]
MFKEFKEFAIKGNVVDLAVGVVIGGAFGKIVSSLVADIISPLVGWMTAGVDITALKWVISPAVMDGDTVVKAEAAITYGNFIQATIDFFIIAFALFLFVKAVNRARALKNEPKAAEAAPKAPTETELLGEILEELKKRDA